MNIKGGIPQMIKKLKNSVANQNNQDLEPDNHSLDDKGRNDRVEEGQKPSQSTDSGEHFLDLISDLKTDDEKSEEALFLAKIYRQRLTMFGLEMVVSVCISYALAWGIGHLFTLSSFSRIILGTLLAFAVHALAVYRIIKR
jgi:hypothetical protein